MITIIMFDAWEFSVDGTVDIRFVAMTMLAV